MKSTEEKFKFIIDKTDKSSYNSLIDNMHNLEYNPNMDYYETAFLRRDLDLIAEEIDFLKILAAGKIINVGL